jgi:nitrate/nitrite transporter NarK
MPTFFVREYRDYNVTAKDFAVPVGLAVLLGGGMGCFLGGFISDRYAQTVCVCVCVCVQVCVCMSVYTCIGGVATQVSGPLPWYYHYVCVCI